MQQEERIGIVPTTASEETIRFAMAGGISVVPSLTAPW